MSWDQNIEETEFNGNTAALMRVDNAIRNINHADLMGDTKSKFKFLKVLMKESLYKMNHKNKTELPIKKITLNSFEILEKEYLVYLKNPTNTLVEYNFNNKLDKFDIHLRDFLGTKGMLLKDAPDTRGL